MYKALSNRIDFGVKLKSIDDLIDPSSNSIHEKCSRIKKSFRIHLNNEVAQNYYISSHVEKKPKHIPICSHKGNKVHIAPEFLEWMGYDFLGTQMTQIYQDKRRFFFDRHSGVGADENE